MKRFLGATPATVKATMSLFFSMVLLYCTVESYSTYCEANLHFAINNYLHIP